MGKRLYREPSSDYSLNVRGGAPALAGTRYSDGSPVVFGPFGGDDLSPVETRLQAFGQAYQRRSWWRKFLNADIDAKTRAAINARYPLPANRA